MFYCTDNTNDSTEVLLPSCGENDACSYTAGAWKQLLHENINVNNNHKAI